MLIMVLKLQSAFYYFISHRALCISLAHHCRRRRRRHLHHFGSLYIILYFIHSQPHTECKREHRFDCYCVFFSLYAALCRDYESKLYLLFFTTHHSIRGNLRRPSIVFYVRQWSILIRFPGTKICTCIAYHRPQSVGSTFLSGEWAKIIQPKRDRRGRNEGKKIMYNRNIDTTNKPMILKANDTIHAYWSTFWYTRKTDQCQIENLSMTHGTVSLIQPNRNSNSKSNDEIERQTERESERQRHEIKIIIIFFNKILRFTFSEQMHSMSERKKREEERKNQDRKMINAPFSQSFTNIWYRFHNIEKRAIESAATVGYSGRGNITDKERWDKVQNKCLILQRKWTFFFALVCIIWVCLCSRLFHYLLIKAIILHGCISMLQPPFHRRLLSLCTCTTAQEEKKINQVWVSMCACAYEQGKQHYTIQPFVFHALSFAIAIAQKTIDRFCTHREPLHCYVIANISAIWKEIACVSFFFVYCCCCCRCSNALKWKYKNDHRIVLICQYCNVIWTWSLLFICSFLHKNIFTVARSHAIAFANWGSRADVRSYARLQTPHQCLTLQTSDLVIFRRQQIHVRERVKKKRIVWGSCARKNTPKKGEWNKKTYFWWALHTYTPACARTLMHSWLFAQHTLTKCRFQSSHIRQNK